jgi:hypothetical protein
MGLAGLVTLPQQLVKYAKIAAAYTNLTIRLKSDKKLRNHTCEKRRALRSVL